MALSMWNAHRVGVPKMYLGSSQWAASSSRSAWSEAKVSMSRLVCLMVATVFVASCGWGAQSMDQNLAPLLLPSFNDEPPNLPSRSFELGDAVGFALGAWSAEGHPIFEEILLYESSQAAEEAFARGQLLGRLSRTITRTPVELDVDDVSAVVVCVDQEKYGEEFCDFPSLLIVDGRFLIAISGGSEEERLRLAEEGVVHLRETAGVLCSEANDLTFCGGS